MEPDYKPDGWLDILIETNLYYKLTSDAEIKRNMRDVKKDIGDRGKNSTDEVDGEVALSIF